jgi:threonylcarbamoyladenosine tRNA methylthiotransferase MtaB
LRQHLDAEVGATRQVLIEAEAQGRTEHFTQVSLATPTEPGMILDLKITAHDGRQLLAA